MSVRILTYVGLLYQDLIQAAQLPEDGYLPPVLPVVLYNGSAPWSAANELRSLIQCGPPALEPYIPPMRHLVIDQGRYRDSELAPQRNLAAALFRLENSRTHAEIDRVLGTLAKWLRSPEHLSLRHAFIAWLRRVILARFPGGPVNTIDDLQEMRAMLADRIQEWGEEFKREALAKGRQEGLAEGRAEGREKGLLEGRAEGLLEGREEGLLEGREEGEREGERRLLIRQLQKRFGALPEWVHLRVRQAPPEQLECWGEKLLDSNRLETLFDDEQAPTQS
jgi:hypothetical protein